MSRNAALAIAALLATSACGASSTNDLTTPTVPAAAPLPFLFRMRLDYETVERSLWTFRSDDQTGKLIPASETPLGREVGGWTVHPSQPYVYVGLGRLSTRQSAASVRTYHVGSDGQLSVAGELALPDTFDKPRKLVLDRSGPRLYVSGQDRVAAFAIDAGPARLITDDVFPGFYVSAITFSARFAYVNMTRTSQWAINVLPIDTAGLPAPEPLQQVDDGSLGLLAAPPSAPFKMIVSRVAPDRNSPQSALQPYTIDPSGRLRPASGDAVFNPVDLGDYPGALAAFAQPRTVAFHPNGRFLYVGESIEVMQRFVPSHVNQFTAGSLIATYRVNPSAGTLTPVPGSPIRTGFPRQYFYAGTLDFSPSGAFLYAGPGGGAPFQDVLGYRIDAEMGALTPLGEAASTFPRQGYY